MKLIDAKKLIELLDHKYNCCGYFEDMPFKELEQYINSLPTVEVVRCKDCRYADECLQVVNIANEMGFMSKPVDYCSYGERKGIDVD